MSYKNQIQLIAIFVLNRACEDVTTKVSESTVRISYRKFKVQLKSNVIAMLVLYEGVLRTKKSSSRLADSILIGSTKEETISYASK